MTFFLTVLPVVLLLITLPVGAGVYKWTDPQGRVHYGDKPQGQGKATELNIDTEATDDHAGVSGGAGNREKRDRMIQVLEEDRKARAEKRRKAEQARNKRQKRCVYLKNELARHQRARGVYRLNSKGERVYYSKKSRQAEERKLKKAIARTCR